MDKKDSGLSPQESLKLIQVMIETTKHTYSDQSPFFLLWGWAVMTGCLLQYYLKVIADYPKHYYAWFITPAALAIHFFLLSRHRKKEKVKTYISEANTYLWIALGFSFAVLAFLFSKIGWQYCYPFYMLLYAVGTYVSGSLIKFKPLIIGGAACFLLAIITVNLDFDTQILMLALAIAISYIIPGHLLRLQYKKKNTL